LSGAIVSCCDDDDDDDDVSNKICSTSTIANSKSFSISAQHSHCSVYVCVLSWLWTVSVNELSLKCSTVHTAVAWFLQNPALLTVTRS